MPDTCAALPPTFNACNVVQPRSLRRSNKGGANERENNFVCGRLRLATCLKRMDPQGDLTAWHDMGRRGKV